MATITVATGTDRLSPSEIEDLHIRLATANSLNDPNINTEGIIHEILSGRDAPVPVYTAEAVETEDLVRRQITANDTNLWDSIFSAIGKGQIDVLDHFVQLGLDVNQSHPVRKQYPIYHAVEFSQTNMMRHLINLGAEVDSWSAQFTPVYRFFGKADGERARTPLMCAAEQGNLNVCKILCESAFADPMLIAPDGQTAQRLAARNGHREIVRYLPAHRGGSWLRLKCITLQGTLTHDR
jgi:ankyrin repeat protein